MKFRVTELLLIWTVYYYRVNFSHVLFVIYQICLINRNLDKSIYPQERKWQLRPNKLSQKFHYCNKTIHFKDTQRTFFQIWNNLRFFLAENNGNVLDLICINFLQNLQTMIRSINSNAWECSVIIIASDSVCNCLLIKML